jgi:aconitate hydratase
VQAAIDQSIDRAMFERVYGHVFEGDAEWKKLSVPTGDLYTWDTKSTYVKHPPYFEGMARDPAPISDIKDARVLLVLADSITTDHISPAGSIKKSSPGGSYLIEHGVEVADYNSYGSRRGNHEVMVRGTFANIRLRNALAGGAEGGLSRHFSRDGTAGEVRSVFDVAETYAKEGVPLMILAGKEYGSGSSRDWAAKGPKLLGVRAVLAESYERIHRSNLVGMGILPLEYMPGDNAASLGLTGEETFSIEGLSGAIASRKVTVRAKKPGGILCEIPATVRIDTPQEREYYKHGGILQYVLRQLLRE